MIRLSIVSRLSPPFILVLLLMVIACQPQQLTEEDITKLEKEYEQTVLSENVDFKSESFQNKVVELVGAYEQYAKQHPGEENATEYLFRSTDLYAGHLGQPATAIEILTEIAQGDSERAGTAAFRIGYVYHNVVNDLAKAEEAYQAFLGKHPNHELVEAAKFEIDNLGVPPEQIFEQLKDSVSNNMSPQTE